MSGNDKLISVEHLKWNVGGIKCGTLSVDYLNWILDHEEPAVDAVTVRHGKWIPKEIMVHNYYAITGFKCSACGEDALDDDAEPMTDYCPHCGARMDAE
jgi:hypothetical protein